MLDCLLLWFNFDVRPSVVVQIGYLLLQTFFAQQYMYSLPFLGMLKLCELTEEC